MPQRVKDLRRVRFLAETWQSADGNAGVAETTSIFLVHFSITSLKPIYRMVHRPEPVTTRENIAGLS